MAGAGVNLKNRTMSGVVTGVGNRLMINDKSRLRA
jgi:hypothetical protein